ncbi:MAG: glycosyltransferase family 1 protein [Microbacteriaceae bacterium]|nr:glycosyltransferase family 1 protein [Microbacteriaceae bacterium]
MSGYGTQLDRFRRSAATLRRRGVRDAARRVVNRLYRRLAVADLEFPLLEGDVADWLMVAPPLPAPLLSPTAQATIGWICSPPSPGSGGHTTLFRMVAELERQGHTCVLFLYDRHGGDVAAHEQVIRRHWPEMRARVVDVADGISGVDACVASGWPTAHVLAVRAPSTSIRRVYFVQDYEPYFHAKGALSTLAEDSYRLGFRTIALGHMVDGLLRSEIGISPDVVEFGCDTDVYTLTNTGKRDGVVFYEKPGNDRRGYTLAKLALEEFHRRNPDQKIHLYGDGGSSWTIPVVRHGRLSPSALNELYNSTVAGLGLSFTNVSLVPEEMLAAGNIPVVNELVSARANLPHPDVVWARATPSAIADALTSTVLAPDVAARAAHAASLVRHGWQPTAERVAEIILSEVYGSGWTLAGSEQELVAE